MAQAKAAFLYRKTNEDVLGEYPEEMRGKVLLWIFEYGFTGKIPKDCPKHIAMALKFVFLSIDIEKRRYSNVEKIKTTIAILDRMAPDIIYPDKAVDGKRTVKKEELNSAIKRLKRLAYRVKRSDIDNVDKEIFDCMGKKIANELFSIKKSMSGSQVDPAVMALSKEELEMYALLVRKINNYEEPNHRPLTKWENK